MLYKFLKPIMMIAIVLLISLLSRISCQQMQSWPSFSKPSHAPIFQNAHVEPYNGPHLPNFENVQTYKEYIPSSTFSSSQLTPRTNVPSMSPSLPISNSPFSVGDLSSPSKTLTSYQMPIASNLSQKMSELLSTIPKTIQTIPKAAPSFEPIAYSSFSTNQVPSIESIAYSSFPTNQVPSTSKITQFQAPTSPVLISSTTSFRTSSPAISSPLKPPRSIIPSPLTDTIPFYPNEEPFRNMFDLPEPSLGSVGCLALTMTPYGTISETPLPDPSVHLPRSPFLPVSSPVSALAPPLSPLLPPASPAASSNNFLRKVPVPPPFI